jgi:hypothetical protein
MLIQLVILIKNAIKIIFKNIKNLKESRYSTPEITYFLTSYSASTVSSSSFLPCSAPG